MPLYRLTIPVHIVVAAPDAAGALRLARDNLSAAATDETAYLDNNALAMCIHTTADLPPGWTGTCLPYGRADDLTIAEILGETTP